MMIITEESPREVLARLKEIEQRISPRSHRKSDGSYADRVIDIDIMAIDELIIDEEGLKVPHPHLAERDFFIRPFLELAPGWRDPRTGLTLPELAEKL
jgi:2-amino-4-hydroxy-6-hydroxymethyldihydropteridine diphosphokinase